MPLPETEMEPGRLDDGPRQRPAPKGMVRRIGPALPAALVTAASVQHAFAHGSERGLVMLLPTGYYAAGSAIAVAASFLLLGLAPVAMIKRLSTARLALFSLPSPPGTLLSSFSFLVLAFLVFAGLAGTHDPLENLLPLSIWTLFWVAFTLCVAVFGNLWRWLNPWSGPLALMRRFGRPGIGRTPILRLPKRLGYLPALVLFFGFAWYELVSLAPDNPPQLAIVVAFYWLMNFLAMILFGQARWTMYGELFSVFYRMVGMMSPLVMTRSHAHPRRFMLKLAFPGSRCVTAKPLPPGGILFVILTLAAVSFDGFSKTFTWFSLIGVNPLEFEGRSQVSAANSIGLLLAIGLLTILFMAAMFAGCAFAGIRSAPRIIKLAGIFIYSLIPISIAFHAAHYLTSLLVNGQYFLAALSDPLSTGADLFGTSGLVVTTSFLANLDDVSLIWMVQTAIIVIGHISGIMLAHAMAIRHFETNRSAFLSQAVLAFGMVYYTVFGLWLLSTASIG